MKTVVVTAVHGRSTHLVRQMEGLAGGDEQPDDHVIVAMNDSTVEATVRQRGHRGRVIELTAKTQRLPVAAARNLGAKNAIDAGAELLIFLDVDCIPGSALISAYRQAAEDPRFAPALLCGPVTYLGANYAGGFDADTLDAHINPHPARPTPRGNDVVTTTDYDLFWSLSFAVTRQTWQGIGGFCTEYAGYGGEDTDFGQIAAAHDVSMCWVGGAHALHQYHPVSDPPIEHVVDIVANAKIFHRRWGWWPMGGWLEQFSSAGLIWRDAEGCPHVV